MDRYRERLVIALIALQGALLVAGDVGCYQAWHCVNVLDWYGRLGVFLLASAAVALAVSEIRHRIK